MPSVTKVLILVSHNAFGERLRMFVQDHLHCTVSGVATNAAAGLELARATEPDLALVDVGLKGNGGFALVKPLLELFPNLQIVLMGSGEPPEYVHAAAEIGALAYLPKTSISRRLPLLLETPAPRAPRNSQASNADALEMDERVLGNSERRAPASHSGERVISRS
jgi:DNA-binding NarL/FixJ family response regulator